MFFISHVHGRAERAVDAGIRASRDSLRFDRHGFGSRATRTNASCVVGSSVDGLCLPQRDFVRELLTTFHRGHLFSGDVIGTRDHRAKQFFAESRVALDQRELLSVALEVGKKVHATLVALDVVGKASLVPLAEADDFRATLGD